VIKKLPGKKTSSDVSLGRRGLIMSHFDVQQQGDKKFKGGEREMKNGCCNYVKRE
jgi:hypothetical protein